jgi:uncharacterized protein
MQVIDPSAWIAQPWKNGAGVTHELVRWPEAEPFAIRISVANILAPAPFSAFAGYRRWLYLLDGGPVTLAVEGRELVLSAAADGLAFAGEANVAATVVARPSRDLNFMVLGELPARADILRGRASHALEGAAIAVFAISGDVAIGAGDEHRVLERHGCAWLTGERAALELGDDAIAAALVVDR